LELADVLDHLSKQLDDLPRAKEGRRGSRWLGDNAEESFVERVARGEEIRTAPATAVHAAPARRLGDLMTKALAESSGSGSYIVPTEYLGEVWDRLAEQSVGLRSGFTVLDTVRDTLRIPLLTADLAAAWTDEAATISASDPTLTEVVAAPRKLAALTVFSNELRDDSTPAVGDVVMRNMLRALALKLDLGFFEGSGTPPEITGIKNVSGIQSLPMPGTNGSQITNLDPFADAIGLLAEANATATAIVMAPRTWSGLLTLKKGVTDDNTPLLLDAVSEGPVPSIFGVPVYLSAQLSITETVGSSSDCTSVYVYEAAEVVAVRRTDARLEISSDAFFDSDQSAIRGIVRFDLVVPNPEAVVRISGITP
jgi:HK97 family phage major capsid protein